MEEIPFSAVRERKGLWLTLSHADTLLTLKEYLTRPFPPLVADALRDAYAGSPHAAELLCDFAAFENIFLDKRALKTWRGTGDLMEALGPLQNLVKVVDIEPQVYEVAICQVQSYKQQAAPTELYLERSPLHDRQNGYFDGYLEAMFDQMFKDDKRGAIPSAFADTQGNIERLFVYANVQRASGAPVKLSNAHLSTLNDFQGALPLSTAEVVDAKPAIGYVQDVVGSHTPQLLTAPLPPIFEMIIDKIKGAKLAISVADAILDIRSGWEGRCFREYLWEVHTALACKNYPKLKQLDDNLLAQLQAFNAAGTSRTRWTKRLLITIGGGTPIEIPVAIRLPRHQDQDYVGFIGRWLGPRQP
ncbi:hypothetical protein [Ensifer adhaerens]|jgi:hypothetical protein|uniref:hypothetical protein n=1 Tax=Ensifer adhaerens TaxID=106592 RepID=UPI0020302023|nr:hypothetical protein [Ensifer adhaerens]